MIEERNHRELPPLIFDSDDERKFQNFVQSRIKLHAYFRLIRDEQIDVARHRRQLVLKYRAQ
uniref:Uncharacterized protein n=1 Tax=Pristionchus pacificus TaxID=54126 RepID=A0A2A6CI28_PRIPA|eukprot:PDM77875.1 hypothetical protein PRIPAC_34742 [Pristionchus pacificus]